jgi:hypothetical protein
MTPQMPGFMLNTGASPTQSQWCVLYWGNYAETAGSFPICSTTLWLPWIPYNQNHQFSPSCKPFFTPTPGFTKLWENSGQLKTLDVPPSSGTEKHGTGGKEMRTPCIIILNQVNYFTLSLLYSFLFNSWKMGPILVSHLLPPRGHSPFSCGFQVRSLAKVWEEERY